MYIVMESAAQMPTSCWTGGGRYRKVAVVKVRDGYPMPKQIHPNHRAVVQIVRVWDRVWEGATSRCAAAAARAEANALCESLNQETSETRA